MAITQVGSATSATEPGTTSSVSVTAPTGIQQDDVLLAFGSSNEVGWTVPSGFTQFAITTDANTPNSFRTTAWYKVCGASEPGSYTFTKSTTGDGAAVVVQMVAYRGAWNVSPIVDTSVAAGGASTEPANPATAFTNSQLGRVFYVRAVRSTSGIPTFTVAGSWVELDDTGRTGSGSVSFASWVGQWHSDLAAGTAATEGAVTCSLTETDNTYILGNLASAPEGSADATLPSVTSAFTGGTGDLTLTLPSVLTSLAGEVASGVMDVTLGSVTMSLSGNIPYIGPIAITLSPVSADLAGAVNPIGDFAVTLFSISMDFFTETVPFGANVIRIEPEKRALLAIQDDPGVIPILPSQVTDA
jgi:hypothetical protein